MNKSFRIQCIIDVGEEYSAIGAVETLSKLIKEDGDYWQMKLVQVLGTYELTEEEI